jgi:hypothetical protein
MENSLSLDDIAQHILGYLNHVQNEHENLMQKLQTSEKFNNDLRSGKKFVILYSSKFNSFFFLKNQRMTIKQYSKLMLIR